MLVSDITTGEVVKRSATSSLQDAVTAMHESDTSYCIVELDGIPSGLLTERDALDACRRSGRPLTGISLTHFATGFDVAATPDKTVYYAVGLVVSHGLEALPVKDDLDIVGILTREGVMANLTNLTRDGEQPGAQKQVEHVRRNQSIGLVVARPIRGDTEAVSMGANQ